MTINRITMRGVSHRLSLILLALNVLALALKGQPSILVPPQSQTNPPGFTVFFGVGCQNATGYRWYLNGQPVSGSGYFVSNEALTIFSVASTNTGPYTVVASNSSGSITSSPVSITLSNVATQTTNLQFSTLASFNQATIGAFPQTGVVQGADGYLYGVTLRGGTNNVANGGYGTIFKSSTNGTLAWSFSFNSANGSAPVGGLIQDTNGLFYGTTAGGGLYGFGTVFSITTSGAFKMFYSFTNNTDGGNPQGTLCVGTGGYLYGDTSTNADINPGGTVFKMDTNGALLWTTDLTTNTSDVPLGGLVQGGDGNFYGTGSADGRNGSGGVFKLIPSKGVTNLYSFTALDGLGLNSDGAVPVGALVVGNDGLLYGTTSEGGANGSGTIFKVSTNGTFTTVYAFDGTNGISPEAGLFLAGDGNFYGTTVNGGIEYALNYGANFQVPSGYPYGFGTVFQMTPAGKVTALVSFNGNASGAYSHSSLWQGRDGGLYGTTANGGTNDLDNTGDGTIFRIAAPVPRISSFKRSGATVSFTWNSVVGEPYQVQYKDALSQSSWMSLGSPVTGTNGLAGDSDTITATNRARFYRIELP